MSFELIETVTVGAGGAASIEFTSIPQDGTDLLMVCSLRINKSSFDANLRGRINGDTGNNYARLYLNGSGATTGSVSNTGISSMTGNANGNTSTASTFNSSQYYFANYTSTTNKSISHDSVTENNATASHQRIQANSYTTTSPITSLELSEEAGLDFMEHSSVSLYKVTAA